MFIKKSLRHVVMPIIRYSYTNIMKSKIIKHNSPNFEDRKNTAKPCFIIIHCTEMSWEDAHKLYMNEEIDKNAGRISPHYVIEKDGTIHQYVDEEKRAWHAGKSYWDGYTDINSYSIGIELENMGKMGGYPKYPKIQMDALVDLCKDIKSRNNIEDKYILGHSDIAPDRKTDPDKHFDWSYLFKNGIGLKNIKAQ